MADNKQNLEKLRKLVDRVQTFDNDGTVLMMQDSRNKKVLYNKQTGEMFIMKGMGLVRIGTPLKPGQIIKMTPDGKPTVEKETGLTDKQRVALRYGEERVWFKAQQIAAMMLDRSGFDELNMVENPMVYYNDGNKWNLKGDNLCWATKEQVDEQKQWLKRFARQDKMRIYIKEVNNSQLVNEKSYMIFRYPLRVEDIEEFRWIIIELRNDGYNIRAEQESLYVKLMIQFMTEQERWRKLVNIEEMGL